ncbi:MAG: hypothetical protein ABFR53_07635 [Actinomycetota bacterium]
MPVVDEVSNEYLEDITFLAIAGRSNPGASADAAAELFSDNLLWGYDESIWDLYGVPGQPASVLIQNGVIVDAWFGAIGSDALREKFATVAS